MRAGTRADRPAAVALLGRAFQAEPVYEWLLPDPERRRRRLPVLLRANLTHLHRASGSIQVATLDGRIAGAAIWDPPGHPRPGPVRRALAWPGQVRALGPRLPRLARVATVLGAAHPAGPHWYLDHLGADPDLPRRGVGGALLAAGLAGADATGVGTYLECKEGNVGYYRRFGFELRDEVVVDPGRLTVLTMWRPPPR